MFILWVPPTKIRKGEQGGWCLSGLAEECNISKLWNAFKFYVFESLNIIINNRNEV